MLVLLDDQRAPATFFYDEWGFVQYRRGWSLAGFVDPHAGHLVAVPAFIYRVGFELFGLTSYRPFRLMVLLTHLGLATAVFAYVRRRVHDLVAGAAALCIAMLGSGWQNIYFPFSVSHTLALALGIIAWILVDRETTRSDLGATAAHLVAVLTSGLGVSVMIGTAARCAANREWMRAVRILSPSAVVYLAWYAAYGTSTAEADNIGAAPRFMADMLAGGAGALFGRDLLWGRILLGILVGVAASKHHRLRLAAAPLGCLVGDVVLVALARAQFGEPDSSRYAYEVAVLILLIAADMATGWKASRAALGVVMALLTLSIWGNWALLIRGALGLRLDSAIVANELRAVEWARDTVADDFEPDHQRAPFLYAGQYLEAVDDLGSPAFPDDVVLAESEATRQLVDATSARALQVFDREWERSDPPACTEQSGALDRELPVDTIVEVRAGDTPVELRVRRFAEFFPALTDATVAPGDRVTLLVPPDDAPPGQWHLQITAEGSYSVCE
ncbi:MAG: hypothetical protein HY828_17035 [Actinobacteria bacterium]|nr:hypothetical protein [Actinomycetota bacterium]